MNKKTRTKEIIGALHLLPLPGTKDFSGSEMLIIESAQKDLEAFQKGGIDSIIFENNYDLPHVEFIKEETLGSFLRIAQILIREISTPYGFNVLWNDYKSALKLAKTLNGTFIRIPVFVDTVETDFGVMKGNPEEVIKARKALYAEKIKLYTDIHVKHARILNANTICESAQNALKKGSDGLIITGSWTGIAPDLQELKSVKGLSDQKPVIAGSGVNHENITSILTYADKVIVSSSLKMGKLTDLERNMTSINQRIDEKKVKILMEIVNSSVDRI